jgi:DNA-binding response OmpR family regulator
VKISDMSEAKKILIVEDEEPIARSYYDHLERQGYEVSLAEDGLKGLEQLEEFQPDLIILDLLMPNMDGREFLKELRAKDEGREMPVLVLTNFDSSDSAKDVFDVENEDYLLKVNTSLTDLHAKIKEVLGKTKKQKN